MIKTFEEFEIKPRLKKGDYVICHTELNTNFLNKNEINHFLDNNVGQYVKYDNRYDFKYGIKYDNVPNYLQSAFIVDDLYWVKMDEIFDWSKNKNDLELKLNIKKYNI
jgi:hypothetical protein